jgi:hypothetical protein
MLPTDRVAMGDMPGDRIGEDQHHAEKQDVDGLVRVDPAGLLCQGERKGAHSGHLQQLAQAILCVHAEGRDHVPAQEGQEQ